ncbi:Alpha-L-fucosidase [Mycobacterium basiliense]|uniref:alpha-L-fucosidase n=1 Tax=Mycobacterium basiliense TaxID=2094119 RepID=A0A447GF30_9MYCO|nr:alpha-L-fucosidase [Mycobacterium basiliense]VDM89065.1 Alpha-L-fucosidase [Mycobacterium basiliense]
MAEYLPTKKSLAAHPMPEWFENAKFGIFIHWGLYSVPGWAPLEADTQELIATKGPAYWLKHNPYAEWYQNTIGIPGSPSWRHHVETYGADFTYDDFKPIFNKALKQFDPDSWAQFFARVNARYIVLTTKHHDGFTLWPSRHPNPYKDSWQSTRDVVGDLTSAVRDRGLKMGLYYSGGYDWTFNPLVIKDLVGMAGSLVQTPEYAQYADNHIRELINRYQPSVLWNDIGYPPQSNLVELFAHYYNQVPDGVINDRWAQFPVPRVPGVEPLVKGGLSLANAVWRFLPNRFRVLDFPAGFHYDFRTPEYAQYDDIKTFKWESTRGVGNSFGNNRQEGPDEMLSLTELARGFADLVSKNGNLLLGIGPHPDGTIPEPQERLLANFGAWLDVTGEAYFDTRPWTIAEATATDGTGVRFTQGEDAVYATFLQAPGERRVGLLGLTGNADTRVRLLGGGTLEHDCTDDRINVTFPDRLDVWPAYALRITPKPRVKT